MALTNEELQLVHEVFTAPNLNFPAARAVHVVAIQNWSADLLKKRGAAPSTNGDAPPNRIAAALAEGEEE